MADLGINIDHIATLRQARLGMEPDPVYAATIAEQNGADQITIHLREDRRHIQLRDLKILRQTIQTKLNLEMAPTKEMVAIAKSVGVDTVTLVPENRKELTTEGGLKLDMAHEPLVEELLEAGIEVSAFLEPDIAMIKLADKLKVNAVEIHTGKYANLLSLNEIEEELKKIKKAAKLIKTAGMRVVAGHGLNYHNIFPLLEMEIFQEYNIGHSIISRAIFSGLGEAVLTMKKIIK